MTAKQKIAATLTAAGIPFMDDSVGDVPRLGLANGVTLVCHDQETRTPNHIIVQGPLAVAFMAQLLKGAKL